MPSRFLASQIKDLGGLTFAGAEAGLLLAKLRVLSSAIHTRNPAAVTAGIGSAALIFPLRWWNPSWPGMLPTVVLASVIVWALGLPFETRGTHFGGIPDDLPVPRLPLADIRSNPGHSADRPIVYDPRRRREPHIREVADGMTARKHRYHMELVAQGIANIASALFGGISVTGPIARTATNIRAGAMSPLSGVMHSIFLLAFMLLGARLAGFVPLCALAGVLMVVCWNMAETKEFVTLLRDWRTAAVVLATLGLAVVEDLTFGIVAGCMLARVLAALGRAVPKEDI